MKEARIYVDFSEMLAEDVVPLSHEDIVKDSRGKRIVMSEGLSVKLYDHDFSSCHTADYLIADGVVELNEGFTTGHGVKWNCRINHKGIYNESQG